MSYQILLHPKADKTLRSYEEQLQNRIKQKIRTLRDLPKSGKTIEGTKFFSLRVGDYRVIYEIKRDRFHVIILFIGHRSVVYDKFLRWLS
ncbi:MAG: type II toxin-antitoxin system RelE family toxin [Candidatus Hodarchaeales archaeon]